MVALGLVPCVCVFLVLQAWGTAAGTAGRLQALSTKLPRRCSSNLIAHVCRSFSLPRIPAALLTYAGMGYALTASVAFPALSLFNLLRFPVMMLPQQASMV